MSRIKSLTDRSLADRWAEVKSPDDWWDDMHDAVTDTIKGFLEGSLECELLEQLQASRYQRNPDRVDYRNGYRNRSLQTRLGVIQNLRVPRSRSGTYQSQIVPRYGRFEASVEDLVREVFLAGVSTRRVGEVLEPLMGGSVSAQTVSRMTKSLDAAVRAYHQRPLPDDGRYLFLDGIVLKVKGAAKVHRKVVLTAYAIKTDGTRELIAFRVCASESGPQWEAFLNDLFRRGLQGKNLRLIITDGGSGLHEALQVVYGFVKRQRCWVHKMRNVLAKLPVKLRDACLAQLRTVYMAETKGSARQRYRSWAEYWSPLVPKAVACVEKDIDELLSFLDEPLGLASKLRTTNAIERAFREVRRRTRPMSCFNNDPSCERIIYAVFSHQNEKWKDRRLPQFTHNT
ncbi:MAG: IS256 family transposase [Chloroflexi bacterium]|nr:IS256 family transposase [Chloroflexota bacterium]